eukprot:4217574-Alexandrium_andersonii.AAC.1
MPIQEVAHAGEEHEPPVTNDPGHKVLWEGLKLCDALHPPIHHSADEHPVPSMSSEAILLSNGGAVKGEGSSS